MTQSLILIAILKQVLLMTPQESQIFKDLLFKSTEKAQLAINSFLKFKNILFFRNELRGLLGLPRTMASDSPRLQDINKLSFLGRT